MKILIVQNRMGIGDMVISLPYIDAISKNFGVPVSILVKENSKAIQFLSDNNAIDKIIILDRDNKNKKGRHDGIIGSYNLIKDLSKYNFDKIFILNSSLRFFLIAKIAGIKNIFQYPLFEKKNQHIINAVKKFTKKIVNEEILNDPKISLSHQSIKNAKLKFKIEDKKFNILLGIGGSGPTKRIPSKIFINFMELISNKYDCRFFLATGKNINEQIILKELMQSKFKDHCLPLDSLNLKDILPIIKNCTISVCNDSSFSHLSAAIGVETIVLMSDTPLIYGEYSTKMHPIIPDGEKTVTHNTLGKDKINPKKIFDKVNKILSK